MSCSVVSPVPQGLLLSGVVSNVCHLYSAVVSWLLYPSGQLSPEALFSFVGSVWSLAQMWFVLTRRALISL